MTRRKTKTKEVSISFWNICIVKYVSKYLRTTEKRLKTRIQEANKIINLGYNQCEMFVYAAQLYEII